MKTLLLIDSRDLADIKNNLDNLFLVDRLNDAEVIMDDTALFAIIDMIEDERGEESSFAYSKDYDEDTKY